MELEHEIYCFLKLAILSIYFHICLTVPESPNKKNEMCKNILFVTLQNLFCES